MDAGGGGRRLFRAGEWRSTAGRRAGERDERTRLDGIDRLGEVEALRVRAAQLAQSLDLLGSLDALDDDALAEVLRERDDGGENVRAARIERVLREERAVDLDGINREAVQVAERRVAGAEVV